MDNLIVMIENKAINGLVRVINSTCIIRDVKELYQQMPEKFYQVILNSL
jgi:hypothetical protein